MCVVDAPDYKTGSGKPPGRLTVQLRMLPMSELTTTSTIKHRKCNGNG